MIKLRRKSFDLSPKSLFVGRGKSFWPYISFQRLAMFATWRSQSSLRKARFPITGKSFIALTRSASVPFKKQKPKPLEHNHYKVNQRANKASFIQRTSVLKITNLTVTASVPKQQSCRNTEQSITLTKSASVP